MMLQFHRTASRRRREAIPGCPSSRRTTLYSFTTATLEMRHYLNMLMQSWEMRKVRLVLRRSFLYYLRVALSSRGMYSIA